MLQNGLNNLKRNNMTAVGLLKQWHGAIIVKRTNEQILKLTKLYSEL